MVYTSISRAVKILKQGGVIIYPTETVYGLGADACNSRAVGRIFELKGRARGKSMILLMRDIAMVRHYARVNAKELRLMRRYWPGDTTFVVRANAHARAHLAPLVVSSDVTVAVRVSSHPIARRLVRALGCPLVSTSANRAGGSNTYSVRGAMRQLGARLRQASFPLCAIGAGVLPRRKPSTVVRVRGRNAQIIRQGCVKIMPKQKF